MHGSVFDRKISKDYFETGYWTKVNGSSQWHNLLFNTMFDKRLSKLLLKMPKSKKVFGLTIESC